MARVDFRHWASIGRRELRTRACSKHGDGEKLGYSGGSSPLCGRRLTCLMTRPPKLCPTKTSGIEAFRVSLPGTELWPEVAVTYLSSKAAVFQMQQQALGVLVDAKHIGRAAVNVSKITKHHDTGRRKMPLEVEWPEKARVLIAKRLVRGSVETV